MTELKIEQLKKIAGGAGPCGQDKGGNHAPAPSCPTPKPAHGGKCS